MSKYESARLKIGRARHHIDDLNRTVASIPSEAYQVVVDRETHAGEMLVKLETKPLDPSIRLIVGDAIVNARSAIDHAFASALGCQDAKSGQVQFPIRDNPSGLIGALKKTEKNVCRIPKPLWEAIVDEIKPYDGGHRSLVALNKLANIEKHRVVTAVLGLAGVRVDAVMGGNVLTDCWFGTQAGQTVNAIRMPGDMQFKGKFKPTLRIDFSERSVPLVNRKQVIPTLAALTTDAAAVIDTIERVCP